MSSIYAEDQEQLVCALESPQSSETEAGMCDDGAPSLRRSSWIIQKRSPVPSIKGWPIPKILEFLFANNVAAPIGVSHEELFALLLSCSGLPQPPNDRPPSIARKASAKCKNTSNLNPSGSSVTQLSKKAKAPDPATSSAVSNGSILAALSSIQTSLSGMDARIQSLEASAAASSQPPFVAAEFTSWASGGNFVPTAGPSSHVDDISTVLPDEIPIPRRTLGSAVPFSTGVPFYPPAAAISANLRSQILAAFAGTDTPNACARDEHASECRENKAFYSCERASIEEGFEKSSQSLLRQ
ncbi:uncharacterized protein LOC142894270 [Nelusetta ayraudi]|uniref:uncharacterized protein LOC142894270 n=1 Tax=Nelusetta ayraudi TaxID=303726 RepID=UPI003F71E501